MHYVEHVTDLVGDTPLVRMSRVTAGLSATVLAKVEYLNPGGSVKDRVAARMIAGAEARGELRPGGVVVEPTSGNTGVGLAMVAQARGYRSIFVCPDKVSPEKVEVLRAYGAQVVLTPTAVAPDDPDSYYRVADRIVAETPGAWKPNQYANPDGPASHYASTGPEIWKATDGLLTHVVAGIGTGGTISGIGRYLHEVSAARADGPVQVVGADPEGSVYSGGAGRPYLVEGVGEDFWPTAYDAAVPDEVLAVSDHESFAMTRRLAREEALLVGGSSGMAMVAALRVARRLERTDPERARAAVIVVVLPDSGRGYLSKIFSDPWMRSYGFLTDADPSQPTVQDVLRTKTSALPDLVHTHPTETVRDAIAVLREYGVSQAVVVRAEPPVTAGEVAGTIDERSLLEAVFTGRAQLTDTVQQHMGPPLPQVGAAESLAVATTALSTADAVLVIDGGHPIGVLTRADLLGFVAR